MYQSEILESGKNSLQVNIPGWAAGVYTYALEVHGLALSVRKMVIVK